MALMMQEVYSALIEAGASEDKATAAAIAIASYDNRLASVETKLEKLQYTIDRSIVESRVIRGIIVSIMVGMLWKMW